MAGDGEGTQGGEGTMTNRRLPAPQAQAFVVCRKITNEPQTAMPCGDGSPPIRLCIPIRSRRNSWHSTNLS